MTPWALDAELKDGAARGRRDGSLAPNDGTSHICKAYNREFCSSAGDKRHRDDRREPAVENRSDSPGGDRAWEAPTATETWGMTMDNHR